MSRQPELSLSSLTAACLVVEHRRAAPDRPVEDIVETLKCSALGVSGLDYVSGVEFASSAAVANLSIASSVDVRNALTEWVAVFKPHWIRAFPLGRKMVKSLLSNNELQCFDLGELFVDSPSEEVVAWWDSRAAEIRDGEEQRRLEQGRYAEVLSIKHEQGEIRRYGLDLPITWMALEDNSAGFDILSYSFENNVGEANRKLIEVKSISGTSGHWYLTRNEWNTAVDHALFYEFHLWKLPEEILTILTVRDVQRHVPTDIGQGTWRLLTIRVGH